MYTKIFVLALFVAVTIAYPSGHGHGHIDYYHEPHYEYKYGVHDPHTKDQHSQSEHRKGDVTHGEYSLHEPDGTVRTVKYTVDKHTGFNAHVIRAGHAQHPAHYGHGGHHGGHGDGHGHATSYQNFEFHAGPHHLVHVHGHH